MPDIKKFIAIGKIVKTIGIKGNLKVIALTDFPARFEGLKKVCLYDEDAERFIANGPDGKYEFEISDCKVFDKYINVKFDGFDTIEESGDLVNKIVMINENKRIKFEEGNYYFYEIVGSEIFDKGNLIGKIVSVVNYGNDDLFSVTYNGKQILIPLRKEFVKNIDIDNKRIDVDLIEGFLE